MTYKMSMNPIFKVLASVLILCAISACGEETEIKYFPLLQDCNEFAHKWANSHANFEGTPFKSITIEEAWGNYLAYPELSSVLKMEIIPKEEERAVGYLNALISKCDTSSVYRASNSEAIIEQFPSSVRNYINQGGKAKIDLSEKGYDVYFSRQHGP